jgi:predicted amidophosphoribosyltransferase
MYRRKKNLESVENEDNLICPECGISVEGNMKNCPNCSYTFPWMQFRCPECGNKLDIDVKRCSECGNTEFELR